MKIKIDNSKVLAANLTLAAFKKSDIGGEFTLNAYRNGRENGYVLYDRKSGGAVTFAENRNSDELVIYPGDWYSVVAKTRDTIYDQRLFAKNAREAVAIIENIFLAERMRVDAR